MANYLDTIVPKEKEVLVHEGLWGLVINFLIYGICIGGTAVALLTLFLR